VLAFSTTLNASSAVFYLGSGTDVSSYLPSGEPGNATAVPIGSYPGQLDFSGGGQVTSITLFFCLTGAQPVGWNSEETGGTSAAPSGASQEEAAFLASLMLYKANQYGITLSTSGGTDPVLTETATGSTSVATFVSTVQGPISMAIWEIMGSLPSETPYNITVADTNPVTVNFYNTAINAWTNHSSVMTTDSAGDYIYNATSGQSFVGAYSDPTLIYAVTGAPEPGTTVLFGTGVLLMALGSIRRLARRSR
jgi:hypothetical protein